MAIVANFGNDLEKNAEASGKANGAGEDEGDELGEKGEGVEQDAEGVGGDQKVAGAVQIPGEPGLDVQQSPGGQSMITCS